MCYFNCNPFHINNSWFFVVFFSYLQFVCRNGTPYTFRNDHFIYSIVHDSTHNEMNSIREPSTYLNGHTSVRISFTPRDTGTYIATFKVNDQKIGGTVYRRLYVAGNNTIYILCTNN